MADNINNRLPTDALGNPVQVAITFRTYDDADTAVVSPITIADNNLQLITVPNNAGVFTVYTTQQLKLGLTADDVNGAVGGVGYTIVPVGIPTMKGIAGCGSFYLRNDSGSSATVYFDFSML